jgi:hypothetical protein
MKERINCPKYGKEMNLMGLRWHIKVHFDNSVLDKVYKPLNVTAQ